MEWRQSTNPDAPTASDDKPEQYQLPDGCKQIIKNLGPKKFDNYSEYSLPTPAPDDESQR
jgi:hypothetical protein